MTNQSTTNWETKKLGELSLVIAGQSPEGKYYNKEANGVPFYQGKKEFLERNIGAPTTWTEKVTKEAEAGDILMSVRAPVGPTNFSTQKICIGRGLAAIRVFKCLDREFLFYFFKHFENEITGNTGAVFNSINKKEIEEIKIPLPPLPEQKRIVTILDEKFEALARAKEIAEQNLRNSRELFESTLTEVFGNPGDDWEEKKLGEICTIVNGGTPKTNVAKYWDGNVLWVTPKDMGKSQKIYVKETSRKITDIGLNNSSAKLIPQNSVILSTRAPIGHLLINSEEMSFNQGCKGLVPNNNLKTKYLYYFLFSSVKLLNDLGSGTTFKELSGTKLKEVQIPLPSFAEQQKIVINLDKISMETKRLEEIYKNKITNLDELKKSILAQAFNGEL